MSKKDIDNNSIRDDSISDNEANCEDRSVSGAVTVLNHTDVILVKSKNGKWIFPKGGIKDSETPQKACEREAFEEAGIIGIAELEEFCVKKNIQFFILKICSFLENYPECETRERKLFKMEDALNDDLVAKYTKEVIKEFIERKIKTFSDDSSSFF